MAAFRPNHVAEAMAAVRQANTSQPGDPAPDITLALVEWLEATFPQRCYTADSRESLEQHLMYAGAVDLVSIIRSHYESQRQEAEAAEDGVEAVVIELEE